MVKARIKSELSTPALCRQVAAWALESADVSRSRRYALISARMFTTFMVEGTIHHLGEKLCATWNQKRGKRRAISFAPLVERHRIVRRMLELPDDSGEHGQIEAMLVRLVTFRDEFAHPKKLICVTELCASAVEELQYPRFSIEDEINSHQVRTDYDRFESYCKQLLRIGGNLLENAPADAFPHLADREYEAVNLRALLSFSRFDSGNTKHLETWGEI